MPTNSSRTSGPSRSGTSASRNDSSSARVKRGTAAACHAQREPRRRRYRPIVMRRTLGALLLTAALATPALAGCGTTATAAATRRAHPRRTRRAATAPRRPHRRPRIDRRPADRRLHRGRPAEPDRRRGPVGHRATVLDDAAAVSRVRRRSSAAGRGRAPARRPRSGRPTCRRAGRWRRRWCRSGATCRRASRCRARATGSRSTPQEVAARCDGVPRAGHHGGAGRPSTPDAVARRRLSGLV